MYLAHEQPTRLVVFVHGFLGKAVKTWERFQMGDRTRPWWRRSDMLFVGYNSRAISIKGMADRLRDHLPQFYPQLPSEFVEARGVLVREPQSDPYTELIVAGHSLGGVVVRHAMCDVAARWHDELEADPSSPRPDLLDAQLRLFSPASGGFRPGGWLGLLRATGAWAMAIEPVLCRSTAYTDLQMSSDALVALRKRTEQLVNGDRTKFGALRASILWADPDEVVLPLKYASDRPDDSVPNTSHSSVCKPSHKYESPWVFVEAGVRR